jgi:hypothetical protein
LRAGDEAPRYAKRASASKLDPYADKLATWFAIEATKSRKQRRNLRQIHTKENIKRLSTPRSLGAHKSGGSVFNGNLRSEIGGIKQAANPPVRVPRLTSLICFTARRGSARRRRIPQPIALLGEAVETCGHSLLADRGQDPVAISSLRWKMRVRGPQATTTGPAEARVACRRTHFSISTAQKTSTAQARHSASSPAVRASVRNTGCKAGT